MSEMVERVGRALAAQEGYAYDPLPYDAQARAAIEAMRGPPIEALHAACYRAEKAGLTGIDFDDPPPWISVMWEQMIDAALGKVDA